MGATYREWEGFQTWEWFYLTVHYSAIKYLLEKTKQKLEVSTLNDIISVVANRTKSPTIRF